MKWNWARYFLLVSWIGLGWVVIDVVFQHWHTAIGDLGIAIGARLIYALFLLHNKATTPKKEDR